MPRSAPIALAGVVCLLVAPAATAAPKRAVLPKKRAPAERVLSNVKRLEAGHGVRTGRELTGALRDLAIRLRALPPGKRREARGFLARPTDGAADPESFGWTGGAEAVGSPACSANFCVHWPLVPTDAPDLDLTDVTPANGVPDYVDTILNELQNVIRPKEVGSLGWQAPPSDGTLGGDGKTDVYIVDFGDTGLFGLSAPDPNQTGSSQHGYLVLDDDYAQSEYGNTQTPLDFMRVTAAHEYNHVLQFGYDVFQDTWMAESTAVWMEDEVYPAIDDYLAFLDDWAQISDTPLTFFDSADESDPFNVKAYGDVVWNRWLVSRYGPGVVRDAWEGSILSSPDSFAPAAYDLAIRAAGGDGFEDEFARFAAAAAEWRATTLGMSEASWTSVPDVTRIIAAPVPPDGGDFVGGQLDHTTFGLVPVQATSRPIKLIGKTPSGDDSAFALVGRRGGTVTGSVTTRLARQPNGGLGVATLTNPGAFQRVTAVLVNADPEPVAFDGTDWVYARDGQGFNAYLSTDFTAPRLTARSPDPSATGVSTRVRPTATFSESVSGVSQATFRLTGPNGATVPASVAYDAAKHEATLRPDDPLSDTTRYTARLDPGILDTGANPLAATTWIFRTVKLPPRFALSIRSHQRRSTVLRRGLLVTLRSRDADSLRFALLASATPRQLAAGARTVARKRGSLRAGKKRRLRVRLKSVARKALRSGSLRVRVKLTLSDPQGNVRRVKRRVVIR